jgi:MinD-like ATPase involved in chromosome partitioning or flagellar assembly
MIEALVDQAAGLRRLLSARAVRTLAVTGAAPSAGHSAVAANLALALAAVDLNVLLVDARGGPCSSAWMLDAEPARELLEAVLDGRTPGEACVQRGDTLRVVRARQTLAAAAHLPERAARHVADALTLLCTPADAVIVDAEPGALPALAAADHVVLVAADDPAEITTTYRFLKRMATGFGPRRVCVVINDVRSPARAQRIFGNLAATAAQFLSLPLECMGQIPDDERQQQAISRRQPLIELCPASPAAAASRRCAEALLALPAPPAVPGFAGRLLTALRAAA